MAASKGIQHDVYNEYECTMAVMRGVKWRIPMVQFVIVFDTDPVSVLKYGPNGLHFVEHLLWVIINSHYQFIHTNAMTSDSGEMNAFGISVGSDINVAMDAFFDGLQELFSVKMTKKMKQIYTTEQRRVTAETFFETGGGVKRGASGGMFTYNTDLLRSEYPADYAWAILLEECHLQRILINVHSDLPNGTVAQFQKRSVGFHEKWSARSIPPSKKVKLPMFYAPAFSDFRITPDRKHIISLRDISNPIIRLLVASVFSVRGISPDTQYILKVQLDIDGMMQSTPGAAEGEEDEGAEEAAEAAEERVHVGSDLGEDDLYSYDAGNENEEGRTSEWNEGDRGEDSSVTKVVEAKMGAAAAAAAAAKSADGRKSKRRAVGKRTLKSVLTERVRKLESIGGGNLWNANDQFFDTALIVSAGSNIAITSDLLFEIHSQTFEAIAAKYKKETREWVMKLAAGYLSDKP